MKMVLGVRGEPAVRADGSPAPDFYDFVIEFKTAPGAPTQSERLRMPRKLVAALRLSLDQALPATANPEPPTQSRH